MSLTAGTAASGPGWETGRGMWWGDVGRGHTTHGACHIEVFKIFIFAMFAEYSKKYEKTFSACIVFLFCMEPSNPNFGPNYRRVEI